MPGTVMDVEVDIDPAKSLVLILETMWQFIGDSEVHPGFDIRSYLSQSMSRILTIDRVHEAPQDWYAAPRPRQDVIPVDPGAV